MAGKFDTADAARLDAVAAQALDEFRLPGFSLGVVSGGELVHARGFGFADIESGRRQDPALRQRIGSITKTMVALCAMAMVDEERLALDDRLVDHIPELVFQGDGSRITVRHLLTHTSGIGEVPTLEDMGTVDETLWSSAPDQDVLALFPNGLTLEIAPDTKWSYANLGFALLGEIVARREGTPIAEVTRRRIFEPLGMTDTDLFDRPHPDLTTGYHRDPGEDAREMMARAGLEIRDEPTIDGINIRGGGAAGAVQSTVHDMAKYAAALLNGGGGVVRPETFAAMIDPHWAPDPHLENWGLSFSRMTRFGRFVFGHGGGVLGGWNSMLLVAPDEGVALIVHANAMFDDFGKLVSRLLAATLNAAPPRALPGQTELRLLEAAPGVYQARPGALTNFRVMGSLGRLQIQAADGALTIFSRRGSWKRGAPMIPGDPADSDFFRVADDDLEPSGVRLIRGPDGRVAGLRHGLMEMVRADEIAGWA